MSGRDNQKRSRLEVVVPTGKMYRRRVGEGGRREEQNKGDDGSDHPHGPEKRTSKLDRRRRTKKTDPPVCDFPPLLSSPFRSFRSEIAMKRVGRYCT